MSPNLSGKVIIVTGANGGLGVTVSQACLEAGASVAAVARSLTRWEPASERILPLALDLSQADACRQAVKATVARFGRLDGLLHLVGGFVGGSTVEETSDEDFERMLTINLRTSFNMFRAAVGAMRSAGGGRIVAVGSGAGLNPPAGMAAYAASKAALHALVVSLAAEVKSAGITANVVAPSVIDTEANRRAMPKADFSRWVTPAAIASLMLSLLADDAAGRTGEIIPIDSSQVPGQT